MKQYQRADRLSEQIRRDLSEIFRDRLKDSGGLITITAVKLSQDLRHAKVMYSYYGSEQGRIELDAYLEREAKHLRADLSQRLQIRHVPELLFRFDPSVEDAMRIEQLLNEVQPKRPN